MNTTGRRAYTLWLTATLVIMAACFMWEVMR